MWRKAEAESDKFHFLDWEYRNAVVAYTGGAGDRTFSRAENSQGVIDSEGAGVKYRF